MTAARRLAANLAADIAGYSWLLGEDEAGTAKIVRERREAATPNSHAEGGDIFGAPPEPDEYWLRREIPSG
jgi:adenylate cyclase